MRVTKDKFPFLNLHRPWQNNGNNIWLASTLGFARNVGRHAFPSKLSSEGRDHVLSLLSTNILGCTTLDRPYLLRAEEVGPLEKEFLYEHFLSPLSFQQALSGEGFVTDHSGLFFALLNVGNHLHLQVTDCNEELERAWERLVTIETTVGKSLSYAYSNRFGFLTADPAECGTSLVARLYLHLPALIHTTDFSEQLKQLTKEETEAESILGGQEQFFGDIAVLRNRCTLGTTEEQILQTLRISATKLIVAEKSTRAALRDSDDVIVKDKVSRAFGLLRHSYQLETPEAWEALSLLKLGCDIGWVAGLSQAQLNDTMMTCRRAHLVREYTDEVSSEELPHRRAEYIHAALAAADLVI